MMTDVLRLFYKRDWIADFYLLDRPLSLGRDRGNDIVIYDGAVRDHECVIGYEHGSVFVWFVGHAKNEGKARCTHLPLETPMIFGEHHSLVRTSSGDQLQPDRPPENDIYREDSILGPLCFTVGYGRDARRFKVDKPVMHIGSGPHNDIVVRDAMVDEQHCRIERLPRGACVRDLRTEHGTFVKGIRVHCADITADTTLRIGRTDLTLGEDNGTLAHAEHDGTVVCAASMHHVMADVNRFARLPWPVLVLGETGAGKEHVARALHQNSERRSQSFVAINAGAIPKELVESELFGHVRGGFTGAIGNRRGVFEQAHKGTLFLDEIGELPFDMQSRLLRVLETHEVRRLGAEASSAVDVRLVCATHRDLRSMVSCGLFREDLFYRLCRLVVRVPPLRDRPEDVPALAAHFLKSIRTEVGRRALSSKAMARLTSHPWKGNVRELRNVVCAAAARAAETVIDAQDIEHVLGELCIQQDHHRTSERALEAVVHQHRGNLSAAARSLGIPRSTLRDRLRVCT